MNLCGWTVSPCDNEFPTYSTPSKANYPIYPKVQSVNNSRIVGKKSIRAINAEYNNKQNFEYQYASPPLPPSKKQNNQYTNATNITTQNFNKNSPNRNNIFVND